MFTANRRFARSAARVRIFPRVTWLFLWPPPLKPRSLSDGQSDPRPVLDRLLEYLSRFVEIVAGIEHALDMLVVLGPLLDLVVIAIVRNERFVGFRRDALGYYHERRDENRNVGLGPEHDWSSHAADAFGYMAVAYEEPPVRKSASDWRLLEQRPRGTFWSA
jgi:hypothetical protein